MAHIISIANQKGGVGKTTTVVTTAHALGEQGHSVLVVDADPQHNTSMILGKVSPFEQPRTIVDIFKNPDTIFSTALVPSKYKNVDLISSHIDMFTLKAQLANSPDGLVAFKNKMDRGCRDAYEFILIDCPPDLGGPFVNNALVLSDYYIITLEAGDYYGLKGMQQFTESVKAIRASLNPDLQFLGVLITKADLRTTVAKSMVESIIKFFGKDLVFKTIISRNTTIDKAAMSQKTVIHYDRRMQGAHDYLDFAKELSEWANSRTN